MLYDIRVADYCTEANGLCKYSSTLLPITQDTSSYGHLSILIQMTKSALPNLEETRFTLDRPGFGVLHLVREGTNA